MDEEKKALLDDDTIGETYPIDDSNTTINSKANDIEKTVSSKDDKEEKLSILQLIFLTISFSGNIMCWSVEIAFASTFLQEILVPKQLISFNWLIGPLTALFIQPIVGLLSDKIFIPLIGRRKPWLVIGCALCAVCLVIFSFCDIIGGWFHHPPKGQINYVSVALGFSSFCILDGSINTVHSAIKTLTIDIVPTSQQTTANLCLSFFAGLGNTLGFAIGYVNFSGFLPFVDRNIRAVYLICTAWLIFTCTLTFFSVKEKKDTEKKKKDDDEIIEDLKEEEEEVVVAENDTKITGVVDCIQTLLPFPIIVVYFVRFFIYFSKFFYFVYMSDAVGRQIFHGDPNINKRLYDKYEEGVRWTSMCFALLSIFNMINSPIINFITQYSKWDTTLTYKLLWAFCQSFQFFGLVACYWVQNKWILLVLFWGLSLMETCCISFPYSIFNSYVKRNKLLSKYKGISAGIFVSSQCFPEVIVSIAGSPLVILLIDTLKMDPGIMISCGGLVAGIALILIFFIQVPDEINQKKDFSEHFIYKSVKWVIEKVKWLFEKIFGNKVTIEEIKY